MLEKLGSMTVEKKVRDLADGL